MSEVKWIKMAADLFDNRKIRQIENMPDGDSLIVIWLKILCLAGSTNDNGYVYFTREIPYTEQMLATQLGRPAMTIELALKTFQAFGMIEIVEDLIHISNWEKYQNVDGMERIREQTKNRVANYRERQKLGCNVTSNVTVTQCNATDIDKKKKRNIYNKKSAKSNKFNDFTSNDYDIDEIERDLAVNGGEDAGSTMQ